MQQEMTSCTRQIEALQRTITTTEQTNAELKGDVDVLKVQLP